MMLWLEDLKREAETFREQLLLSVERRRRYLDLVGSPTALRDLVERLRKRLPDGVSIVIGLWADENPMLKTPKFRALVAQIIA